MKKFDVLFAKRSAVKFKGKASKDFGARAAKNITLNRRGIPVDVAAGLC